MGIASIDPWGLSQVLGNRLLPRNCVVNLLQERGPYQLLVLFGWADTKLQGQGGGNGCRYDNQGYIQDDLDDLPTETFVAFQRGCSRLLTVFVDVQLLIFVHFFAKIGFVAHEATSLKLVEKGLKREDLAVAVLIDFPFQILGGWLAAKWSRGDKPLRPWLYAFWPRFFFGLVSVLTVLWFPKPPITPVFFAYLIAFTVISSFTSYVHCPSDTFSFTQWPTGLFNLLAFQPSTRACQTHWLGERTWL